MMLFKKVVYYDKILIYKQLFVKLISFVLKQTFSAINGLLKHNTSNGDILKIDFFNCITFIDV